MKKKTGVFCQINVHEFHLWLGRGSQHGYYVEIFQGSNVVGNFVTLDFGLQLAGTTNKTRPHANPGGP
jgi:hypothetical protein